MHANQAALRPNPPRPAVPAGAARAALRAQLAELAAMLEASPAEDRAALRERVRDAQRGMRGAGVDDALLALLLRNMLVDLAKTPGRFDAAYFADQLSRVAERLG